VVWWLGRLVVCLVVRDGSLGWSLDRSVGCWLVGLLLLVVFEVGVCCEVLSKQCRGDDRGAQKDSCYCRCCWLACSVSCVRRGVLIVGVFLLVGMGLVFASMLVADRRWTDGPMLWRRRRVAWRRTWSSRHRRKLHTCTRTTRLRVGKLGMALALQQQTTSPTRITRTKIK